MIELLFLSTLSPFALAQTAAGQLDRLSGAGSAAESPEAAAEGARFEPRTAKPSVPAVPVQDAQEKPMSLADKAKLFQERMKEHRPWFGVVMSRDYGENGEFVGYSSIADGQIWTGNFAAAQAFRYEATKDEEALRQMEEALWGLHALAEVTGVPGLVARAIIPKEYGDKHGISTAHGNPYFVGKGKYEGTYWKGRISNDQITGYAFGLAAAYPHIRDPKLKEAIRQDLLALGRHIIKNDMRIVGPDGTFLDFRANHYYQQHWPGILQKFPLPPWRGGNAMHGLHVMRVCASLTGDPGLQKYYEETMVLDRELDEKARKYGPHFPLEVVRDNQSALEALAKAYYGREARVTVESMRGDLSMNLGHMAMFDLNKLEDDPELKKSYRRVLQKTHDFVSREGNTYWNFLYAAHFPEDRQAVADGIDSLKLFPTRRYLRVVDNTGLDVPKYKALQSKAYKRPDHVVWFSEAPLPFDKRSMHAAFAWQQNPYRMEKKDSRTQGSGVDYLVAYWLGRKLGVIAPGD